MKIFQVNKIKSLIFIIILITIFWACKKTDTNNEGSTHVVTITGSVSGLVTDLNNVSVSNASVSAGTSTATTDINGKFSIANAQLSQDDGFVKVAKDGYFEGSRTFIVSANTINNVKIQLIPKTVSGSFTASSGGNINVSGGGSVSFSSGIVNATSNAAYTGSVSVSTFYLNPSDPNFNQYMPGDLRGINTNNKENILQSFGMVLVELNDASGGKLQLASGKTATITLPIPAAMQASAPASIPLWYFDETTGIWKQEGSATKQGTDYVGNVKHFSFWTAGQLAQDVKLDATFKDSTGNAFTNKLVTITSSVYGTTNGYTDNAGTVSGLVPANEMLVMKVFDDCGGIVYTQNIGPFSTDANLGDLGVTDLCTPSTDQYIKLTLNGVDYSWTSIDSMSASHTDTSGYNNTLIQGMGNNWIYFYIIDDNTTPGTYNIKLSTFVNGISYPNNDTTTTVTEYGVVGGNITGTSSGELKELDSTSAIPFTLSYKVKRIQ